MYFINLSYRMLSYRIPVTDLSFKFAHHCKKSAGIIVVNMAEGVVMEDGKLSSETSQISATVVDAGGSSSSLPTLLVVVSEPLSETHKDAVVKRIATGTSSSVRCRPLS